MSARGRRARVDGRPIRARPRASELRRQVILDAALACFLERGFDATTVDEIRERSGASIGSLYHHFGGKERIAAAVYVEALRRYQRGFVDELRRHRDARAGIQAIVGYHVGWVARNRDWARYLLHMQEPEVVRMTEGEVHPMNQAFLHEVTAWVRPLAERGLLAPLPVALFDALWLGAAHHFARHYLADRVTMPLEQATAILADAAWDALRGGQRPAINRARRARSRSTPLARRSGR